MNKDCKHKTSSVRTIKREVLDLTFEHKARVCVECGAYLRDGAFEKAYLEWLEKVYEERRDKFQVQCHISVLLEKCVGRLLEEYPGVSMTGLLRGLVTIYLNHIDVNATLVKELHGLLDKRVLNSFMEDVGKKKHNIQFKPKMMLDIVAVSEFTLMKPHQIVETSIIKMSAAYVSQDRALKKFWENEIQKYVDLVLKSA